MRRTAILTLISYVTLHGADCASGNALGTVSRAIAGWEQSRASSADGVQAFFADFVVSTPAPLGRNDPHLGPQLRALGTARVTTVPQQSSNPVTQFVADVPSVIGKLKPNELVQAAEVTGGLELRFKSTGCSNNELFATFSTDVRQRFVWSLLFSGGFITPVDSSQEDVSRGIFRFNSEAKRLYGDAIKQRYPDQNIEYIAFARANRDRFYRQYWGGIGMRAYYYQKRQNSDDWVPSLRFPATFDLLVGQNEAISGGKLHGTVLRADAFYPMPWENASFIYLYFTGEMRLRRATITAPSFLEIADSPPKLTADNVGLVVLPEESRDRYRVGIGIDLLQLIKMVRLTGGASRQE